MISNKIQETFGIMLPLYSIEEVVTKGEFSKHGKTYNMVPVIQWAFKATADQLVAEVLNKWNTLYEIDCIILGGGGAIRLGEYITPEFENIHVAEDSQWAVANGYWKWGKRTWKEAVYG
jgi:hypothetical protein